MRRLLGVLRATQHERGWAAAAILGARALSRQMPILLRQIRAAQHSSRVRAMLETSRQASPPERIFLAVTISGGLGDMLVIARFLRDLTGSSDCIRIYIFTSTPHLASWVFQHLPGFSGAYHDMVFSHLADDFDIALRACQFVVVYEKHVKWQKLKSQPRLAAAAQAIIRFRPRLDRVIERHPWLDNDLARIAVSLGTRRRDFLHMIAGISYGADLLSVPIDTSLIERHELSGKNYITIHNGFDTGFLISGGRATKCYPHFGAVVDSLKRRDPSLIFVQIGAKTSERIEACDIDLLNATTLSQAAGLIRGAAFHIDNEGGLVHLAACLGKRAAVIFGPTPVDYFGYDANLNITPPVCGSCWWSKPTWMDLCPKSYEEPRCMTQQDPLLVADAIWQAMSPNVARIALCEAALS